jgi:serine/threonine-protein kinase RsbW
VEHFRQNQSLHDDKLPKQFHLRVKTELAALNTVWEWFEQSLQNLVSAEIIWQCQTALTEGFTNSVCHGHRDLPTSTPIDIELNLYTQFLEIKIWDFGQPFDLQAKLESEYQDKKEPLKKEGDRGLLLIQSLTDNLQYIRTLDGRNCLIMVKNLDFST